MKKQQMINNKKRRIDIYFVLYLAALVLLISKTGQKENIEDNIQHKNFDLPFILKAEKPLLTCNVWVDSLGKQYYELDSINYIWNIGDVEDVRYEFVVEDKELKHSMHLSKDLKFERKVFNFKEDNENKMAIFYWYPLLYGRENKTYIVHVTATAKLINSSDEYRIKAKTQFSLVVTYLDSIQNNNFFSENLIDTSKYNIKDNNYILPSQSVFSATNLGPLSLFASSSKIKGIAFQEWENTIFCMGVNPKTDLAAAPKLEIKNNPNNNDGTVYIHSYTDNTIVLRGRIPAFGTSKVFLTLERKRDVNEATVSFEVTPQDIESPIYPREMYPEQNYVFNPKLPFNIGNAKSILRTGNKIRGENYQGGIIEFTPSQSDTGKTFVFERFINDVPVGTAINIKVNPNAKPIITRVAEKEKNVIILNISSFGIYNSKENRIKELIITGNAKYKPLYGKTSVDRTRLIWYEQFEIVPIDIKKTFSFTVIAIDNSGKQSEKISY